ncbi:RNA polymerase sigma factor [Roseimarinus sediminis]|uniref:RNA polymerase sigma factor n=1 Tax=Roseimarinus sediminis TaxID=1610899 RepID=UPI003D1C992C
MKTNDRIKEDGGGRSKKARDDQQWVQQALAGDEKAYARLLLKYKDAIYYMLLKIVKNKNDAEDLTLEAFGKAFTNLNVYSPEYAFSTWLYRIATNNCIDFMRRQKGIHYSIDSHQESETESNGYKLKSNVPDPEERMILKQRGKILQGFIGKLKPQYQTLIDLRYFKEYSYEEIAKALDLPLGTVKVQLFRARNLLFDLIGKADVND